MANDPVIPWDYYERMRSRQSSRPVDPVAAAVADMRSERAKRTIMDAPDSPADAARITRVARETGEPPALIESRLPDYEKAMGAQRFADVASRYSIVADWFEKNPRSLVAAQGDVKSVGFLGRTLEFLSDIPDALQAGTTRTAKSLSELYQSIDEAILPFTNPSGGRAQLDRYESDRASYQRRYEVQRPRSDSFVVQSALSGIESIPGSATGIAVGVVSRSPGAAAAVMGLTTGAPAYREALDAGKTTGTALRYGVEQGLIEGLTEKVPAGKWLDAITKRTPAGKAILSSLAAEIPGEQLATILQDFSTWATLTPNRPFSEYLAERPQAALQTAIATITGTAAQVGATQAVVKTGDALVSRAQSARRARAEREVLTGFEKAAADSTMRANDPQGYAEMVGNMAEQSGVTGVMVDAAAVREYMQSDSYDPYSDPLEAYRDQVDEAFEVGGDVVLPSDFALGTLPGTSAWTALRDDMRLTAGGITPREAQSFEEAMADVVAEVEASQQQEFDDQQAQIDAQGKLMQSVQDKLMNAGFTPYTAQQQATLIVQRIATRAARMGREVQGNEFTTEVRQVLPPELAAARDADATDLVINALRKGKDPTQQSGPSLLEWISARGGVNDSGGDLASMGLDQWHKGKPGKRKLVRKFDPTASLGGISGAGDYGVDTTLRAAIEAGYFPELANVANEGGVDTLDTQVLLDAMSAELAGVKRYAADARVDTYRAAAEELDQLLQQRGLDPAGMSDAELRAAIAGLDKAGDPADGRAFGQSVREGRIRRTIDELVAAAESQESWRTWYQRHEQTIIDMFGEDADLFQKLLSATSQATGVKGNVTLALKAYDQLFSGDEFTGYLPAVIKNLERIRADEELSGAKISQYGKANEGDTSAIAVDRHIAMLFFNTKTPNPKQIAAAKKRIVEIAKRLAWEPRQVQAALWAFNQVRLGTDPDKVESYDKILESRISVVAALRSKHGRGKDGSISVDGRSLEGDSAGQENADQRLAPRQLLQSDAFQNYGDDPISDVVEVDDFVSDEMVPSLTAQDLVGLSIFPTIADRTAAAAVYGGIDSAGAVRKIALLGGPLFPLRLTNWLANVVWANRGKSITAQKADKLVKGATHMLVVMGDTNMHISNTTVQNAFLSTIEAYIRAGRISPESLSMLADMIRAPSKITIDSKTGLPRGKGKKTLAVEKRLAEFPGFDDVRAFEQYVHSLSFEARKRVLAKMSSKEAQKLGAPSMTRILDATREPTMAGHRWGDGVLLVELDKERPFITLGEEGTMPHPDFPLGIRGKVVGRMKTPLNYETLWSEWTNDAKSKGKKNVRRAFELAKPVINVTQELADQIAASEASGIDSARQARLAVDFVLSNWKTTDAGVKQGGISPQEYLDAIDNSPAKAVLSEYTLKQVKADVKTGAMTVYQLGADGQIFFALKRGDPSYAAEYGIETPGITDNEVMLTSVINNEQGARGVGGPAVVLKALQEGATVLDCFAVKNDKFVDGFLPKLYAEFGFEKVAEAPFDLSYYDDKPQKLAEAVRYWKESTPGYDPETHGYPPLVIMKWAGTDEQRATIVGRYLSGSTEGILAGGHSANVQASEASLSVDSRAASEGSPESDAGAAGGLQGTARRGLSDRLRRLVGAVGSLTPEGARNLGLTPEEVDQVRAYQQGDEGRSYNQDPNDGPRGRITFDNGPPVIELFQGRNLSTLLHELGHQYLEELHFDANSLTAPDQLIKDMETVKAWFAANGHPIVDGVIPTEAHEMWARGFERYLMEGKAPSSALARVFETLRGWMLSIYKKVEALRSPITPEIREVFDRLLATDEELQQQREAHALMPLFKDAAEIMTGPEFQAYQDQFTEARVDAQSEVLVKAMREVKARVTKEYRDQRAVVEADVTESVDQRPLFRALRNLKTMPVRKGWLEDNMGLDVFDLMPKRVPPLWSDKGAHPDAVAEMSGYGSGRQMIEALIGAEMAHRQAVEGGDKRTLRERTIQSEVDAIMRERYGDPLTDGTIEREALAAVNNEKQGEVLASELRILSRKTGQRPTPYRIARQWARNKVRQGVYATEASPSAIQRHARAVAKHGSEAEKAMLAGKFDEAFAAKQKQMLSSALLAEAKAANDEVTTAQRYLDKIARAKTMKSVDQDYLDQAQALLEDVDLRQRSQKSLDRKESFERWAAAKQAAGEEVYVPDRFDYAGTNWSRLPVEQLLGLADTVKSIMHLGRHKQTMLDNKDRREFDEWKADALAVLELTPGRAITNEVTEQRSNTRAAMALGLKVETLALELDNGVPGVWTALLSTRPTTAENERAANREKVLAPIAEAFRMMDRKDRDRLADRVTLPEMPFRSADLGDPRNGTPLSVSRMELIGMALNMGNESNFDKLARGYGVEQSVIEGVVNRELTEKDWQFVQSIWDALETLWPDIAATEREMSGVEPERVEVREVVTPFGTLRGGYYPLVYDPSQSQVGEDNLAKASDDMFGLSSGVATAKGHTKARTGFAAPLLLSPEQVIFGHVEKVITRNAYAPLVRDILKVMRDPIIRAAFDRKMGREYREMIEPWLRRQVRAGVTDERGVHWANKVLRQARINVTLVSMGLRFSTGVAQIAGITNSIGRIGVNQFRKGFARVLSNPRAAARFVFERSPEMERRNMELNRDVAEAFEDLRNTAQGRTGVLAGARVAASKARAFAFWHIGMIDRYVVSMPTWLGAYEQAVSDGKSEEEASALADSAVRQSQGSGREKDMAAIQSPDSEALKFFTMFYTPFNVLLNAQWETARGARRGDWRKVAELTFWFMIAAPLVDALLSGDAPDDDDDETWAAWLARNVLSYQVAGIPIIRDIGNYAERKIRGEYVTFGSNPVTRIFDTTARTGKDAWNATLGEGEVSDRWVRNAVETPGYFLGLPTGQVSSTSQFMWDYSNGDVDPETIGDWYQGLTKGKLEEE